MLSEHPLSNGILMLRIVTISSVTRLRIGFESGAGEGIPLRSKLVMGRVDYELRDMRGPLMPYTTHE